MQPSHLESECFGHAESTLRSAGSDPKRKSRGGPSLDGVGAGLVGDAAGRIRPDTIAHTGLQNVLVFGRHCRKRRAEDRNKQSRVPEIVKILEGASLSSRVGIEACASAHPGSRELQALGHTVRMMPPTYVTVLLTFPVRVCCAQCGAMDISCF